MKVNWIRVKNFRSIIDSGICYFNDGITVLAGKNESGKTNILQALECFSKKKFDPQDKPQDTDSSCISQVCVSLQIEKEVLMNYGEFESSSYEDFELIITRSSNGEEAISGKAYDLLVNGLPQKQESLRLSMATKINKTLKMAKKSIVIDKGLGITEFITKVEEIIKKLRTTVNNLSDEEIKREINNLIKEVSDELKQLLEYKSTIDKIKSISSLCPRFILFSSFNDLLPEYLTAKSTEYEDIVKRFFKLAHIEPSAIFNESNGQKRRQMTDHISANITTDFRNSYFQDHVELKISLDGERLYFFIYEKDGRTPYKPIQRSKGFQWFLASFLTMNSENDNDCVLLIDEPGLYLHPKAQNDVLTVLEGISQRYARQIVFTTHSPYLIDPKRLDRIRLVIRDQNHHTSIENKFYKGADRDTLTPIITAIGLDISRELTFSPIYNILVEGISDYFYLQGMRKYLGSKSPIGEDVHIVANVGASQIPQMAAILYGWNIDFKVLLDSDQPGNQTKKKLMTNLMLDETDIIQVSETPGLSIEDLFSQADFRNYVLGELGTDQNGSNSELAKKFDKVLLARQFCARIFEHSGEIKLDNETVANFTKLLAHFPGSTPARRRSDKAGAGVVKTSRQEVAAIRETSESKK